jgi:hypothetical protein
MPLVSRCEKIPTNHLNSIHIIVCRWCRGEKICADEGRNRNLLEDNRGGGRHAAEDIQSDASYGNLMVNTEPFPGCEVTSMVPLCS